MGEQAVVERVVVLGEGTVVGDLNFASPAIRPGGVNGYRDVTTVRNQVRTG